MRSIGQSILPHLRASSVRNECYPLTVHRKLPTEYYEDYLLPIFNKINEKEIPEISGIRSFFCPFEKLTELVPKDYVEVSRGGFTYRPCFSEISYDKAMEQLSVMFSVEGEEESSDSETGITAEESAPESNNESKSEDKCGPQSSNDKSEEEKKIVARACSHVVTNCWASNHVAKRSFLTNLQRGWFCSIDETVDLMAQIVEPQLPLESNDGVSV